MLVNKNTKIAVKIFFLWYYEFRATILLIFYLKNKHSILKKRNDSKLIECRWSLDFSNWDKFL